MALIIKHKTQIETATPTPTPTPKVEPVQLTAPAKPKIVLKFGGAKVPVVDVPVLKPKVVLKFGGGIHATVEPTQEAPLTERQQKHLVESGLMEETIKKWEPMMIGSRVTITNSMFPWVQHYRPGDQGLVTQISNNRDPLGVDETGGHTMHVIVIDMPLEAKRKGQTCALFRWEFEHSKMAPASTQK